MYWSQCKMASGERLRVRTTATGCFNLSSPTIYMLKSKPAVLKVSCRAVLDSAASKDSGILKFWFQSLPWLHNCFERCSGMPEVHALKPSSHLSTSRIFTSDLSYCCAWRSWCSQSIYREQGWAEHFCLKNSKLTSPSPVPREYLNWICMEQSSFSQTWERESMCVFLWGSLVLLAILVIWERKCLDAYSSGYLILVK